MYNSNFQYRLRADQKLTEDQSGWARSAGARCVQLLRESAGALSTHGPSSSSQTDKSSSKSAALHGDSLSRTALVHHFEHLTELLFIIILTGCPRTSKSWTFFISWNLKISWNFSEASWNFHFKSLEKIISSNIRGIVSKISNFKFAKPVPGQPGKILTFFPKTGGPTLVTFSDVYLFKYFSLVTWIVGI